MNTFQTEIPRYLGQALWTLQNILKYPIDEDIYRTGNVVLIICNMVLFCYGFIMLGCGIIISRYYAALI